MSLLPVSEHLTHFGFRIDAQGIGNTVDVVEIGDDLDGVEDVAVT